MTPRQPACGKVPIPAETQDEDDNRHLNLRRFRRRFFISSQQQKGRFNHGKKTVYF